MNFSDLNKLDCKYKEGNYQVGEDYPQFETEKSENEVLSVRQRVSNFFKGLKDLFVTARSSAASMAGKIISCRRNDQVKEIIEQLSEIDETKTKLEPRPASRFSFKGLKDLFASAVSSASRFLCCFRSAPVEIERAGVTYD
jgi:hypothetical protein